MKDLEYLRKMNEEARKRALSKDEIEDIHNCLHTNMDKDDTNEALDLSAAIADEQVKAFGADVDSLLDTILYHGGLKGAENATLIATNTKLDLAAKFIDSEQYDKFESMSFEHINKDFVDDYIPTTDFGNSNSMEYIILDKVKTLKGVQYLVNENLISDHINGYDQYGHLTKITEIQPDGLMFRKDTDGNLLAIVDKANGIKYTDLGIVHEEDEFMQSGHAYGPFKSNPDSVISWYERDDDYGGISLVPMFKDEYDNWHKFPQSSEFVVRSAGGYGDEVSVDEQARYMDWLEAQHFIRDINGKTYFIEKGKPAKEVKVDEKLFSALEETNNPLQTKLNMLRERLGNKVGKTADVTTGKVSDEHRETAKAQVEISKAIMKARRAKEGKGA